jgi:hypothetical protein
LGCRFAPEPGEELSDDPDIPLDAVAIETVDGAAIDPAAVSMACEISPEVH